MKRNKTKKLLTEQFNGNNLTFTTEVKMNHVDSHHNISIRDIEVFYADLSKDTKPYLDRAVLTVKWSVNFDIRNWGMKDIKINIEDIYGDLTFEYSPNGTEEVHEVTKQYKLHHTSKIKCNMDFYGAVFPSTIEINGYRNQIFVN